MSSIMTLNGVVGVPGGSVCVCVCACMYVRVSACMLKKISERL